MEKALRIFVLAASAAAALFIAYVMVNVYWGAKQIEAKSCPASCRPASVMYENRTIPPIHSFAKPFKFCGEENWSYAR